MRLADMLAHYAQGQAVAPDQLLTVARRIGLGPQELREVMYELPGPPPAARASRRRARSPTRELEVLKRLAEGKVYKQIALELGALDQHGAHAPAQRLRQARRRRPRAGRADRLRARLAVAAGRCGGLTTNLRVREASNSGVSFP